MGKKKSKQQQQTKAADAANVDSAALREKILLLEKQLQDLNNNTNNNNSNFGFGLGEVVAPPEKSGYLFKWQDRSIGWGGTKWGLRFVRLTNGQLSYYKSHEDKSPSSGGEGGDKNEVGGSFHVFSVYQRPVATVTTTTNNNKISNGGGDAQGDDEDEIIPY
ncbi:hypothetical protein QTG54_014469 [Skeletonema marinoi]|uniref:PH domain-containing protein n=1 Tax=Skeletonema marinoi TaxID=267567 RepID=A0AAD8XWH0_9STRA|nr:hypothetical protein QTG54_014469 [Skeletonema marinoi]